MLNIAALRQQQIPLAVEPRSSLPFHILMKPIGPACNLACRYCYYPQDETPVREDGRGAAGAVYPPLYCRPARQRAGNQLCLAGRRAATGRVKFFYKKRSPCSSATPLMA